MLSVFILLIVFVLMLVTVFVLALVTINETMRNNV